ncbi:hypothetical protein F4805DRAFT_474716 [Annulohypoxylon moriforme]|nr:hypothetical protein F4805DRAFT_474716 [Annulohypoxylon moriforme]
MATLQSSWLDAAFKSAKEDFKRSLKNPALYDFEKLTSIEDVLEEAKKIERQQAKTRTLRGLRRIQPLINGLKEYSAIIEVFAQAKPDIMSLIWGPLKFILQASSSVILAFEKVVKVIADVGMTLPSFKIYTEIFQSNYEIRRALCLFFADILDFYAILLNFLTSKTRNIILESLWPNIRSSITRVRENIDHHKAIMTTNVTLQDVLQAHQARKRALEEYEQAQKFRDNQTFSTIRSELNPHDRDIELARILRRSSVVSGEWLKDELDFMRWHDPIDRTARSIWLYGIPGSGKTFIVANLINAMRNSGQRLLFAFLSHNDQVVGDTIKVLHSFLFQLLDIDPSLRTLLHETSQSDYKKLKSDTDFVTDLLCKILKSLGPTFVILDGLDELDEYSWGHLLAIVLKINKSCPETKLLISSRDERDIASRLRNEAISLRVDYKNCADIKSFVQLECESLLFEMRSFGASQQICLEVKGRIDSIAEKAAGMFIYARLVMLMVKDQGSLQDIEAQIQNLPDGLDEVYGRLLDRAKKKHTNSVRTILQWVACARRSLSEEEMLQILSIEPGQQDFTKGRRQLRDICKTCGPIIEINDSKIQFVHFSAREYLLHEQSNSFLNLTEAHIDATITCTAYLSFSSLNPLFSHRSDDIADIQKRVMDGDYVLFEYASMAFLEHLKASLKNEKCTLSMNIIEALNRFREIRTVDNSDLSRIPKHIIHMFKKVVDEPKVQAFLSIVTYSQTRAQLGMSNADEIMNSSIDPLRIFSARRKLRQSIEDIICQELDHRSCGTLEHLYGTNVYHCDQPFCYAYQRGFGSRQFRDQHLNIHQRPYKCTISACLFMDIGFCDASELQRHLSESHPSQILVTDTSGPILPSNQPKDDTLRILEDAVALDQKEVVENSISEDIFSSDYIYHKLLATAAGKASKKTLAYLINWKSQRSEPRLEALLSVALEYENLPNIGFLLSRGAKMSNQANTSGYGNYYKAPRPSSYNSYSSYMTGYVRALSLWSPTLMAYLVNECHVDMPLQTENAEYIFAYAAVMNDTLDQARKRFNEIRQYVIWSEAYALGVALATREKCYLGARVCLENGGDPNGVYRTVIVSNQAFKPALYFAATNGQRASAELLGILLQYGADVEHPGCNFKKDSKRLKKIMGYFGLASWEEMVRGFREGEDLSLIFCPNRSST